MLAAQRKYSCAVVLAGEKRAPGESAGYSCALCVDTLPELIQMLHLGAVTGVLSLWRQSLQAAVHLERGSVVHARCGELTGLAAFRALIVWTGGRFWFEPGEPQGIRSISGGTVPLLMEAGDPCVHVQPAALSHARQPAAAERDDERAISSARLRMRASLGLQAGSDEARRFAAQSFQRGVEQALRKRYRAARAHWELAVALDPDEPIYQANLRRAYGLSATRGGNSR